MVNGAKIAVSALVGDVLADQINELYMNWFEWMRIVTGKHSCWSEMCKCDKVIEFAEEQGWSQT